MSRHYADSIKSRQRQQKNIYFIFKEALAARLAIARSLSTAMDGIYSSGATHLALCWLRVDCVLTACWLRVDCMLTVCWLRVDLGSSPPAVISSKNRQSEWDNPVGDSCFSWPVAEVTEWERLKRMSGVLKTVLQSIWMLVLQSICMSVLQSIKYSCKKVYVTAVCWLCTMEWHHHYHDHHRHFSSSSTIIIIIDIIIITIIIIITTGDGI